MKPLYLLMLMLALVALGCESRREGTPSQKTGPGVEAPKATEPPTSEAKPEAEKAQPEKPAEKH